MFMRRLTATASDTRSLGRAYDFSSSQRPSKFFKILWLERSRSSFKKMRRARPEPVKQYKESLFEREGTAKTRIDGKEHKTSTVIKFDTGSDCNIVSETFVQREFPGLKYDGEPHRIFAKSVSGKESLVSKGTVPLDWYCPRSISPPPGGPHLRPRFEQAVFHVIEAEGFELLLGQPDIQRLNIFTFNPEPCGTVGTIFTVPQDLGSNVSQEDADAARRREKEKQEVKERKKKIKEENAKKE